MLGHGASIVRDGLVLHLDAANPKSYPGSGTTWKDLSGLSNDATLINGTSFTDKKMIFDGVNDAVTLPDITSIRLVDTTFEFIFKIDNIGLDRDLLNKGTHAVNTPLLIWFDVTVGAGDLGVGNVNCISVQYFDGSVGHWIATNSNTIQAGKYYMLTVVGKESTNQLSIYLNGVLAKTNTKSWAGIQNTNTNFRLGSGGAGENLFDGEINYFSAYNRALSESEVQQNFNALRGRYGI